MHPSEPEDDRLLRRLYNWAMTLAAGPHATRALAAVAFLESSDLPDPARRHAGADGAGAAATGVAFAPIATAASIVGGLAGYAIGYFLYETLGQWIIHVYGLGDKFDEFQRTWNEWGVWIILIKGLTPIPYKLVTIASGLVKFNLGAFIIASIVTRGARFFLLAALLRQFGAPIREFIEKRLTLVTTSFAALIVLGFVALHYL